MNDRLARSLKSREQRSTLRALTTDVPPVSLVDLSSNDYLSFASDTRLRHQLLSALVHQPLYGPASSRLLDGNTPQHRNLELQLAAFFQGTEALLFNSGFDANVGLWSCLPDPTDFILYDQLIHASTHDGMRSSRVPLPNRRPFRHNDLLDLERLLLEIEREPDVSNGLRTVWVTTETLFSMDGDLAPLQAIVECVERCLPRGNGHLVIDEAHSTGLYGAQGRGIVCALGLEERITVRVHTFGKAIACTGAVVVCNPLIRSYLINYARPLIYSTVMPYMNVLAIANAFHALENGQGDIPAAHVHTLSALFLSLLSSFVTSTTSPLSLAPSLPGSSPADSTLPRTTPIIPLLTRFPRPLSQYLKSRGFLVRPISHPTVPRGEERVRICLHGGNSEREVRELVEALRAWVDLERERESEEKRVAKL